MGAKTALLAFADGDVPESLRRAAPAASADVEALVRRVHPGHAIEPAGEATLDEGTFPPAGVTHATVVRGAEVLCDRRLVPERPSELPGHLLALGAGRRIVMHGMHSVVDWLCFAVWEDGELVRSLSLSPDTGVVEDVGEPYEFERPFRAGDHPVGPEAYPLPFHPLELGEAALRALFGFVLEEIPAPGDVDAEGVRLRAYRVTDPTGAGQDVGSGRRFRSMRGRRGRRRPSS